MHPTRRLSFWVQFHYPFWCNNPVAGLHTLANLGFRATDPDDRTLADGVRP
jgi:hypothetical protein